MTDKEGDVHKNTNRAHAYRRLFFKFDRSNLNLFMFYSFNVVSSILSIYKAYKGYKCL